MAQKGREICKYVEYMPKRRCSLKDITNCKAVATESGVREHRVVVCRMNGCRKKDGY